MKLYNVVKINTKTEKETNYGQMGEDDVKLVTKGYRFNGLFYERANSIYIIIVNEK